ncbi:hypothetical protein [Nocardia rhizosphaerihabitans]|uniref:hypothetical protein n=1 Tax=Nocardia rhizosphaerihabitans TaxID=1691570 RepID=UPI0016639850|nr:hypothetical protein [Nocardia rhizosphaerihabitans]
MFEQYSCFLEYQNGFGGFACADRRDRVVDPLERVSLDQPVEGKIAGTPQLDQPRDQVVWISVALGYADELPARWRNWPPRSHLPRISDFENFLSL